MTTRPEPSELDAVLCRTPFCQKQATTDGVCNTCRQTAALMIQRGETTGCELIELGLLLPADAESGYFSMAFEAALERRAKAREGAGER